MNTAIMRPPMVITTSWDDGHPLDRQLADLLEKYGIAGTFYMPRRSQRETLGAADIRRLATRFEIGAHTLDHLSLTSLDPATASLQIADSKAWIESVTARPCDMFCPPLGKFSGRHVEMIRDSGYIGFRTVEMGSIQRPDSTQRPIELATTIQSHPHRSTAYLKNALRRRRLQATLSALRRWSDPDWRSRANWLLERAIAIGGVFHLWGHSWEIDENHQWQALESFLSHLGDHVASGDAVVKTNGELAREAANDLWRR